MAIRLHPKMITGEFMSNINLFMSSMLLERLKNESDLDEEKLYAAFHDYVTFFKEAINKIEAKYLWTLITKNKDWLRDYLHVGGGEVFIHGVSSTLSDSNRIKYNETIKNIVKVYKDSVRQRADYLKSNVLDHELFKPDINSSKYKTNKELGVRLLNECEKLDSMLQQSLDGDLYLALEDFLKKRDEKINWVGYLDAITTLGKQLRLVEEGYLSIHNSFFRDCDGETFRHIPDIDRRFSLEVEVVGNRQCFIYSKLNKARWSKAWSQFNKVLNDTFDEGLFEQVTEQTQLSFYIIYKDVIDAVERELDRAYYLKSETIIKSQIDQSYAEWQSKVAQNKAGRMAVYGIPQSDSSISSLALGALGIGALTGLFTSGAGLIGAMLALAVLKAGSKNSKASYDANVQAEVDYINLMYRDLKDDLRNSKSNMLQAIITLRNAGRAQAVDHYDTSMSMSELSDSHAEFPTFQRRLERKVAFKPQNSEQPLKGNFHKRPTKVSCAKKPSESDGMFPDIHKRSTFSEYD